MNLTIIKDAALVSPEAEPVDILLHATADTELGKVLIARSLKGVCAILIGDSAEDLVMDLADRFPGATLIVSEAAIQYELARVRRYIESPAAGLHLTLDLRGTPFQRRVWEKLQAIPVGRTVSYQELARWISPLANPRSVGRACAANPIALAIPCHRVVRSNGDLAGYRWGIERKRVLIQKEAMA
ncbi:MAG TPA: methylated-DNA--[protein]-cysteine S-methyltransferase [Bosea sp. (in: a-proteobacteria)]|jgi:methylated-DNA-[protein]-cysteine S-methyltransferase/AraC family transcriptional regulator of adaptative response/methylated-DNA-[protein]-cysteine methyltransferase|nr:methylated-DNA--[protein]-cysteine S-methyltransferase [Bosea sp. (in: a-proteobacteria)]